MSRAASLLTLCLLLDTSPALAWFTLGDKDPMEVNGVVRAMGLAMRYPDIPLLYPEREVDGGGAMLRLMALGTVGTHFQYEAHLYQTWIPEELTGGTYSIDVERSALLEKNFSETDYNHLAVDQLYGQWSLHQVDLSLGRQPINLATNFYFTPNDLFAPFAASNFYRVYKPGVDAVRLTYTPTPFSQLQYIGVLGYEEDTDSDTGWSYYPAGVNSRHIGLYRYSSNHIEWSVLAGQLKDDSLWGGAMQGELFETIGIRGEGHRRRLANGGAYNTVSLGADHRWESSLEVRLELFFNGGGAKSIEGFATALPVSGLLGQHYSALGLSYELTPLLQGQMLLLSNYHDHSQLYSINAIYSLSDEGELALSYNKGEGKEALHGIPQSEFGSVGTRASLELRYYF